MATSTGLRRPGAGSSESGSVGVFRIVRRAVKTALADNVTSVAAALAYYFFLAIPSALLVAAGVFGLVAGPDAVQTVVDRLGGIVPADAITLVDDSLTRLTENQSTGVALVVVGGVLAVWSLTGAAQSLMWALNVAHRREEGRGFVRRRVTALAIVLAILGGFALVATLLVLGPYLSTWIGSAVGEEHVVRWVWWTAQWPLLAAGLLVAFAAVLYLGPDRPRPRFRIVTIGAAVTLVIWLAGSALFAFYVSRFGSYNKAWGSLSAVVVTLVWLWLSAVALLLGAEIDAEIERERGDVSADAS
jgi:membrane protein